MVVDFSPAAIFREGCRREMSVRIMGYDTKTSKVSLFPFLSGVLWRTAVFTASSSSTAGVQENGHQTLFGLQDHVWPYEGGE